MACHDQPTAPKPHAVFTAVGEVLVDFTEAGVSEAGQALFERNAGGAPANFLAAVRSWGPEAHFVGAVGDDLHGRFLRRALAETGIGTDALAVVPDAFTTLAFVALDRHTGERSFSFARNPGADTLLSPDDIPTKAIAESTLLHFGSLSLTHEPARAATHHAVRTARQAGTMVSFDPNYRADLWSSRNIARMRVEEALACADVVKMNADEAALFTGRPDQADAASAVLAAGPRLVVITRGADGCLVAWRRHDSLGRPTVRLFDEQGFPAKPLDTTGAGDVFWGTFLARLADFGLDRAWSETMLRDCARTACAAACLCVETRGGMPSVPARAAVMKLLDAADAGARSRHGSS